MNNYTVTWTIDLEANSPVDAARKALEIQRDPGSIATFFTVMGNLSSKTIDVDLEDYLSE